ncbi:MAG: hypothetical protein EPN97_16515 [Alphaproteobacteria bacterium]|nr:MAG: hypothetical protein EPN97_16515 [Alphaproteobacteria bacterium]
MKYMAAVFALSLVLYAAPVQAFETPAKDEATRFLVENAGSSYRHYASDLGCKEFAWGDVTPDRSRFTLKYVPAGSKLTDASSMVVITVYGLSGNIRKDTPAIEKNIALFEAQYRKLANVTDNQNYMSMQQERMLFLQYYMGKSPNIVYSASVYLRTGPSSASFISYQSRLPIPQETVVKVHKIVNPQAKTPEEEAKSAAPE